LTAESLTEAYDRDAASLLAFFARRTYDPEASVDLLAETFAVAFAARAQFRGDFQVQGRAWLFTIARHQLSEYFRRGQVERRALRRLGVERRALGDAEYERIEDLAESRALREQIVAEASALTPEQREILRLRVLEERPYRDVAAALGISEPTARARVRRALMVLRGSQTLLHLKEAHDHA